MAARQRGQIARLVAQRGFGFIRAESGQEYFFHRTGLRDGRQFSLLDEELPVSFELEASAKGPRAVDIELE